mgnify:CR=1 FL=1|tara:strand:+ start:619 stop:1452 length:834 start_codon:yes stop_codon:yes gene_type:complete
MKKHSLDLLENAVDSLEEALKKYNEGEAGNYKSFKFSILHLSHFIELIFKHHISSQHRLLIYKNPFAQNLDESKTISFWDSVNFISHETGEIGPNTEFRRDLNWLKNLRNDIEHYKFEMEVDEVRETIGRIFLSLQEFLEFFTDIDLKDYVPDELSQTFKELSDEYESKLKKAKEVAESAERDAYAGYRYKEYDLVDWKRLKCTSCENDLLIPNSDSGTGYRCTFCENEESDFIPIYCDNCGCEGTEDDMEVWPYDDGPSEYRCYYCSGRYHADKDD